MMERLHLSEVKKSLPGLLLGTGALALCGALSPSNRFLPGLILIVCAVTLYFWFSFIARKNWWDLRAVFSATWLATIGLASFRLTDYQVVWEYKTWLYLAVTYALFILASSYGLGWGGIWQERFSGQKDRTFGRIKFALRPARLFWVCFVVTLVGMGCFAANVAIRGYIPYFSTNTDAYLNFYTRFHIFSTAASMISGLCYYTLFTQKLPLWKKIFLILSILYSTFLFPMLVVSRGMFLTSAVSLLTVIFYLHRKKLWVLVLCTAVTLVFYAVGTEARGYSEDDLLGYFEPSKIVATEPSDDPGSTDATDSPTEKPREFQLSGSAAFVYSYLTVSHDNFNLAVKNVNDFTYGARQLVPFNVILRMDWVDEVIDAHPYYKVRPHLNTINIVGDAYYDFGFWGILLLMPLWAFGFGTIQSWYEKSKGVFALLALGVTMTPVAMCFFSVWMSLFQTWMFWGLVLIMFLASCVTIVKTKDN